MPRYNQSEVVVEPLAVRELDPDVLDEAVGLGYAGPSAPLMFLGEALELDGLPAVLVDGAEG